MFRAVSLQSTVTTCEGQLHRAALAAIADAGEKLERFRAGESPHTRRIHYRRATQYGVAAANECDYDEYLDIPGEAVRARNGWQSILKRCAPARSGQEPLALIALITGAILIDSMHGRADSYREVRHVHRGMERREADLLREDDNPPARDRQHQSPGGCKG
jgi:hypothetical protein